MRQIMFCTLLVVLFALPTICVNAANIEDGLWMYLPLNEGAGEKVADHGPNNFDTELSQTAPKWVDAKHDDIGKALEFDGKSTYVKIDMAGQGDDIDSHFDDKKGITICAWVKPLKTGTDAHGQNRQPIVMKGNANQWEFALYVYDNFGAGMSVWTCPGSGVSEPSTAGTAPQGEWTHQCGTFKLKEGVKVYVNGEKTPSQKPVITAAAPVRQGSVRFHRTP